jgi:hypothetical protein
VQHIIMTTVVTHAKLTMAKRMTTNPCSSFHSYISVILLDKYLPSFLRVTWVYSHSFTAYLSLDFSSERSVITSIRSSFDEKID